MDLSEVEGGGNEVLMKKRRVLGGRSERGGGRCWRKGERGGMSWEVEDDV